MFKLLPHGPDFTPSIGGSPIQALVCSHAADVALWLIDLETMGTTGHERILSAAEQARANRFRFTHHAQHYRASHLALRQILGRVTDMEPPALEFREGPHGKPHLRGRSPWHFNMSHSAGWALIGVSTRGPIGVDLEMVKPLNDAPLLAQKNFSAGEYAEYQRLPTADQTDAFFRCWTRKEACLKALGSGLSIEPAVFEAGLHDAPQTTYIAVDGHACAMTVTCVDLPLTARAALACLTDPDDPLAN
ncbi:MAG: 4'-phosphopantetheinyl transferase superfamily protein [Burkholderiales bacterium]|nr:4'-phosphopantetheinyl transferase superfamily protein [Burkholderiales bacterium]